MLSKELENSKLHELGFDNLLDCSRSDGMTDEKIFDMVRTYSKWYVEQLLKKYKTGTYSIVYSNGWNDRKVLVSNLSKFGVLKYLRKSLNIECRTFDEALYSVLNDVYYVEKDNVVKKV